MKLFFDDNLQFQGRSFGAHKSVRGEVVFNTGMTGYIETLTDPSYCGQILVLTYPLQGNYGVPDGPFESNKIQVQGVVVSHYSEKPSHYTSVRSLGQWLKSQGVPGICGVDTRTLTRYLREFGTTMGTLLISEKTSSSEISQVDYTKCLDIIAAPAITHHGDGDIKILVIDTGAKENIIRSLLKRNIQMIRAPWNANWEQFIPESDGIFLTNGPGNPEDAVALIGRIRKVLDDVNLPVFGICLGHQLLALAAGGKTTKLKYGHRSVNQPVRDVFTNRCYISSQNHGYVVDSRSLSDDWEVWFVNVSDGTNEGIRHKTRPISSVQFHPEASPGPRDTDFLFDNFVDTVRNFKNNQNRSH